MSAGVRGKGETMRSVEHSSSPEFDTMDEKHDTQQMLEVVTLDSSNPFKQTLSRNTSE